MKRSLPILLGLALLLLPIFTLSVGAAEATEQTADYASYYVEDGLLVCADFYQSAHLSDLRGDYACDTGSVTLAGLWVAAKDGRGITYDLPTVYGYKNTGIVLDSSFLGGDYTVETVADPYGILDEETGAPYYPDNPVRVVNAFSFGPLKTVCYPARYGVNQNRSVYYYDQPVGTPTGEHITFSNFFATAEEGEAVSFSLTHLPRDGRRRYEIFGNGDLQTVIDVSAEENTPDAETDWTARLFYGFPATVYALRVYDRVLTEEERAYNHFVDICAYHGLPIDVLLSALSEGELASLCAELGTVSVSESGLTVGRILSRYLYAQVAQTNEAFGRVAREYQLNVLPLLTEREADGAIEAVAALDGQTGLSALAVQSYFELLLAGKDPYGALITFDRFVPVTDGEAPALTAVFRVDTALLALLETRGQISFGTMVGYGGAYTTAAALTLNEDGTAGAHAARYLAYTTGDTPMDEISFRVNWDEPYQTRDGYKEEVRFRAFLRADGRTVYIDTDEPLLPRATMLEAAKYFVCAYEGDEETVYAYNADEALRKILWECSVANVPTKLPTEDEMRLEELKKQLADGLAAAMAVEEVRYCGKQYDDYRTPAIWIEYLGASVDGDTRIRPAYIYFPAYSDPTGYSNETAMKNAGISRVFAYIGQPAKAQYYPNMTFPGIVCVHGGGGHAYIQYVKEAVNHGYFAIAPDTDGFTRQNPTAPDAAGGYVLDLLGMKKDSLENSHADMTEQWQYYVQRALIYCNTVLRSFTQVDESSVGITGISWGGFAVTTNIQYDDRYAFAVPVYLSSYIAESEALSLGSIKRSSFVAALWQDAERLSGVKMPVLLLNGDGDPYASLNTTLRTYYAIPNAEMCILHGLTHSQQKGASQSEIYLFADRCIELGEKRPSFVSRAEDVTDRSYVIEVAKNDALTEYTATLYYQTEPILYNGGTEYATCRPRLEWQAVPLTVAEDGTVEVTVPEEAAVYYVAVSAYNDAEEKMPAVYYEYTGTVTATTPLIPVGCKGMYELP